MKQNPVLVAMVVLYQQEHFLMQLRDDKQDILYPGRWGLFGGHLELEETPVEGVIREVKEEINYQLRQPEFFRCYTDEKAQRYIFAAQLHAELDSLKLCEGQDFDLVPLSDVQLGRHYSPKIREKRKLGSIHRQIILDFASFAQCKGSKLF